MHIENSSHQGSDDGSTTDRPVFETGSAPAPIVPRLEPVIRTPPAQGSVEIPKLERVIKNDPPKLERVVKPEIPKLERIVKETNTASQSAQTVPEVPKLQPVEKTAQSASPAVPAIPKLEPVETKLEIPKLERIVRDVIPVPTRVNYDPLAFVYTIYGRNPFTDDIVLIGSLSEDKIRTHFPRGIVVKVEAGLQLKDNAGVDFMNSFWPQIYNQLKAWIPKSYGAKMGVSGQSPEIFTPTPDQLKNNVLAILEARLILSQEDRYDPIRMALIRQPLTEWANLNLSEIL